MQATFEPGERKQTLGEHYAFAKVVADGKLYEDSDLQFIADEVIPSLFKNTRHSRYLRKGWGVEFVLIFFVVISGLLELTQKCNFADSLQPTCAACYSDVFVLFLLVTAFAWFCGFFVFLLLKARGFHVNRTTVTEGLFKSHENIPPMAITLWLYATAVVTLLWGAGIYLFFRSNRVCSGGDSRGEDKNHRSLEMLYCLWATIAFLPVSVIFLRR
eukprot:g1533.t1